MLWVLFGWCQCILYLMSLCGGNVLQDWVARMYVMGLDEGNVTDGFGLC